MSYTIDLNHSLSAEIRRIAEEGLDEVIGHLQNVDEDPNEAVHEARKGLKKLRATVRLVRDEVGRSTYKRENVCYRDAGRVLSDARDSFVQIETVQALHRHFDEQLADDAFDTVEERLKERHRAEMEETVQDEDAIENVLDTLHAARARIEDWPIDSETFDALGDGLKRVYRRGRKAYKVARKETTAENLHEWRKRAKYLRYQVDMLQEIWPNLMVELEDTLHNLTDYLGDDHDLAVLQHLLVEHPELSSDETHEMLLGLIEQRRSELQQSAWPLGQRLYAEKPKAFVRRMAAYWDAAQNSTSQN